MENKTRIQISKKPSPEFLEILTEDAVDFLVTLHDKFGGIREKLLLNRKKVLHDLTSGKHPTFLAETKSVRESDWTIAPTPKDLQDRRVEITGPVDRKMVINALNSGAKVFMADFEDSHCPTWNATIQGQINLRDATNKTISFKSPEGKSYQLNPSVATLMVRPRGWHLLEKHFLVDSEPISASLFDFGLFFYHNAKALLSRGTGPYFYLPKMESYLEARLWNDVFRFSQDHLKIPQGTIKATVLIETILAAFQMDEILFELKEHSAGLNCGRWDYIFSFIKKFSHDPNKVFPDRALVTMTQPCMKAYYELLIKTCHRRKAHAMGGMAAQIPIREDAKKNEEAMQKVIADKKREAEAGHDGTWVAHPALVPIAREVFDSYMKGSNQLNVFRDDVVASEATLLVVPTGTITEQGLRMNVSVGLQYLAAWLSGNGCVPLYHLMEDAATAEISRAQVWQWIRHPKGVLVDGRKITTELFRATLKEELSQIENKTGPDGFKKGKFKEAAKLFDQITTNDEFPEFLTLDAYDTLIQWGE